MRISADNPYPVAPLPIGPKWKENVVLKSHEWYYIVFMQKYYQLTLFLGLIGKFGYKSSFQPRVA